MDILSVRYRRLQSSKYDYGHTAIEAEARVEEGETPTDALTKLRAFVDAEVAGVADAEKLIRSIDQLQREIRSLERSREELVADVRRGRAVISEHKQIGRLAREAGLDQAADKLPDGIPF